ncbi:nuclear transport factor 2 family protein [Fulvivirgaceae bacterium BMA12]|uniref:Nuclear transport factor 2 family protein n=1 Tax=Agaribacillus aureus TaxID=3051825 RepID=A0ABT8L2T4_9BACT|nr:nuclear transport factor 2 family protein [Fulvivirgaceae bacterium BMA12]
MEQKSNKTIVLEFYKHIIGECDISLVDSYVHDQYIQHNPTVKDGKSGLSEMITYLKQIPKPAEQKSPIVRIIEDGDFVAAHLDLVFMGKRMAVMDLFRLEDGKLVEHWDAIQGYPEQVSGEFSMTGGAAAVKGIALTDKNKSLVKRFLQEVIDNQGKEVHSDYLNPDYVEHNPEIIKTARRLDNYLADSSNRSRIKIHRIIGEGNFVLFQSEGTKNGRQFVFYDMLSIEDNQIVEHWSVEQEIPDSLAHTNGMI